MTALLDTLTKLLTCYILFFFASISSVQITQEIFVIQAFDTYTYPCAHIYIHSGRQSLYAKKIK